MIVMGWCGVCGTWRPVTGRGTIARHFDFRHPRWMRVKCPSSGAVATDAVVTDSIRKALDLVEREIARLDDVEIRAKAQFERVVSSVDVQRGKAQKAAASLGRLSAKRAKIAAKAGGK